MDKRQTIQTFVCIVEHGSLTAAAATLGRSSPSGVRTLAALEQHLHTRLLARTTRRIALTEGRRYLVRARRILTTVQDAEAELSAARAEPGGHLSITMSVMFGQMHVVSGVAAFLSRHPQARDCGAEHGAARRTDRGREQQRTRSVFGRCDRARRRASPYHQCWRQRAD